MPSCSSCCETKASSKRAIRSGLPGLSSPERSQGAVIGWGRLPTWQGGQVSTQLDVFEAEGLPFSPRKKRYLFKWSFHIFSISFLYGGWCKLSWSKAMFKGCSWCLYPLWCRDYTFQGLPCMASKKQFPRKNHLYKVKQGLQGKCVRNTSVPQGTIKWWSIWSIRRSHRKNTTQILSWSSLGTLSIFQLHNEQKNVRRCMQMQIYVYTCIYVYIYIYAHVHSLN